MRDDAVDIARSRYPSIGFPFLRRQGENPDIVGRKHSKDWNNIAAFPSAPASHKVEAKLPMSAAWASVVNLKFLISRWHPRLGTSNSRTTLESIDCKCGFESEIRSQSCPEVWRISDS